MNTEDQQNEDPAEGSRARMLRKYEGHLESLFELEGLGRDSIEGVDPDEFVRQLREGWESSG
jgi:hypothetical protein